MTDSRIRVGHYYSNGAYGRTWGVRRVSARAIDPHTGTEVVAFKGVAGSTRGRYGSVPIEEFLRWVKYEVQLNENDWIRIGTPANDGPPPAAK